MQHFCIEKKKHEEQRNRHSTVKFYATRQQQQQKQKQKQQQWDETKWKKWQN